MAKTHTIEMINGEQTISVYYLDDKTLEIIELPPTLQPKQYVDIEKAVTAIKNVMDNLGITSFEMKPYSE